MGFRSQRNRINFLDQKIGQMGSNFDVSTLNAELDLLHTRINELIENGDLIVNRVLVASNYTVNPRDSYVGVNTGTAAITITLPPVAQAIPNRLIFIKDESNKAGTNNITITPNSSETIDRATSKTISTNCGSLTLLCTGTEWFSL